MQDSKHSAMQDASVAPTMAPHVQEAIAQLGRTEDIRFSPNNQLAAIAGFKANTCLLLPLRFGSDAGGPTVQILDYLELESDSLEEPHGFDFVDDTSLVVANRAGRIAFFDIPPGPYGGRRVTMVASKTISRVHPLRRLRTPGSVCVLSSDTTMCELLVCNTFKHRVSYHRVRRAQGLQLPAGKLLLAEGLEIPDGVAISPDGRFIAISNHDRHCVSIFDRSQKLGPSTSPTGHLDGVSYAHGIRFSSDGKELFVADAGAPVVHRFFVADGNWNVHQPPEESVRVLSEEIYLAGRQNPREGGPKGIDIDRTVTLSPSPAKNSRWHFLMLPNCSRLRSSEAFKYELRNPTRSLCRASIGSVLHARCRLIA